MNKNNDLFVFCDVRFGDDIYTFPRKDYLYYRFFYEYDNRLKCSTMDIVLQFKSKTFKLKFKMPGEITDYIKADEILKEQVDIQIAQILHLKGVEYETSYLNHECEQETLYFGDWAMETIMDYDDTLQTFGLKSGYSDKYTIIFNEIYDTNSDTAKFLS